MASTPRVTDWNDVDNTVLLLTDIDAVIEKFGYSRDYVKTCRYRKKKELTKRGIKVAEILSQPEPEKRLREELIKSAGRGMVQMSFPEAHLAYHQKLEEALESDGRVEKATFREGSHRGYIKNTDGEIEYTEDMPNKRMEFSVNFETEPKWPVVHRVESVKALKKESRKAPGDSKRAIILPDLQVPFQDEKAISVALQVLVDTKPDQVIFLGDVLDLSAWSKYEQRPEFAQQTQGAINYVHTLLATIRKTLPSAEIVVMAGNHELRMETSLLKNAQAAFGLKKATDLDGWPVMSVPYLCAFDQLDVKYVPGYPANRYWINERLQVRHGNVARPGGRTAKAVADSEKVTTITGHVHRIEAHYKTQNVYGGGRTSAAFAIGCLCRIDGRTPSVKQGHDLDGRPIENYEDWQSGFMVVDYHDGDAPFYPQQVYVNTFEDYKTQFGGKIYEPKP